VSWYLDASALLPRIVEERTSDAVDAFLNARTDTLVVSEFAAAEVASAISRLVRMGQLNTVQALGRLSAFDTWRIVATRATDMEPADLRLANAYVRRFDLMLRAPDAIHAAICVRLGLTLVTLDRRLASAAQSLGVKVLIPAV